MTLYGIALHDVTILLRGLVLTKQHFSAKNSHGATPTHPAERWEGTVVLEWGRPGVEFHFCYLLAVLKVGKYKSLSLSC